VASLILEGKHMKYVAKSKICCVKSVPLLFLFLHRLHDEANIYVKRIEVERKKIDELDHEITTLNSKILDQKTRMGGVNASWQNNLMIQKQISVLNNRLDKSLLKFNETLAQNKELRTKIDEYRRERCVFDGIYKKLERELHEKKIVKVPIKPVKKLNPR
jgi:chromosome segregation ATPase